MAVFVSALMNILLYSNVNTNTVLDNNNNRSEFIKFEQIFMFLLLVCFSLETLASVRFHYLS